MPHCLKWGSLRAAVGAGLGRQEGAAGWGPAGEFRVVPPPWFQSSPGGGLWNIDIWCSEGDVIGEGAGRGD